MKRGISISVVGFFVFIALQSQLWAASITETSAAIGKDCVASGDYSTAMGYHTEASGDTSTAMGYHTEASGTFSTASGYASIASGYASTAMGLATASGYASTASGYMTDAGGAYSWAGGVHMKLMDTADYTFVWGQSTIAQEIKKPNAFLIFPVGEPGKVGIGTPEPESKLDIRGATNDLVLSRLNQIGTRNWCGVRFDRNTSEKWFIGMDHATDYLLFRRTSSSNDMMIDNTGDLRVAHDAYKPGGGSWADSSDERLKTNINELNSKEALDKITQLRGVTFEWINTEEHAEGLKAGILAQELEGIFPDWVEEVEPTGRDKGLIPQGEKAKAISFPHDFNAYLIEAIKELKAQNEKQQAEIEELRSLIKELKG